MSNKTKQELSQAQYQTIAHTLQKKSKGDEERKTAQKHEQQERVDRILRTRGVTHLIRQYDRGQAAQLLLLSFMARLPEMNEPNTPLSCSKCVDIVGEYWEQFKELTR